MRTHIMLKKIEKISLLYPPALALRLILTSSNYPCLEHIFIVPKMFEPLKFYCNQKPIQSNPTSHPQNQKQKKHKHKHIDKRSQKANEQLFSKQMVIQLP